MAPDKTKGNGDGDGAGQLNCFVVIGFGRKTDFATGRVLDLDKTYTKLIKPAFDRVGVHCFRAIDVNRSGSIDKIMYHWIYHADIVITDLSTNNPNVLYELGVRHAQKPKTSILIGENQMFKSLPFDLSHTVIHAYEHQGDDIADAEAERFVGYLAELVQDIIDNPLEQDSPIYTYMEGMEPPQYVAPADRIAELEAALAAGSDEDDVKKQSLSIIAKQAEQAKNTGDFATAKALFKAALEQDKEEIFLHQRLALVTYKEKEKDPDDEVAIKALRDAEAILEFGKPRVSADPETLGLAGAINKRLFQRTGEEQYLDKSIYFYERGFYIAQDYYNGINVAFMYNIKADLAKTDFDAIMYYGHALLLRRKVAEVCQGLIESDGFDGRGDKEWIYQTLAQAHLGMDNEAEAEKLVPTIQALSKGSFDLETFKDQNRKLLDSIASFKRRIARTGLLAGAAGEAAEVAATPEAPAGTAAVEETAVLAAIPPGAAAVERRVVRTGGQMPISIDLGNRPVKSIELTCKVEYA